VEETQVDSEPNQVNTSWYVKAKRAQTNMDDETWTGGGVVPTVNGFDMGDSRATTLILYSLSSFAGYAEGGGNVVSE